MVQRAYNCEDAIKFWQGEIEKTLREIYSNRATEYTITLHMDMETLPTMNVDYDRYALMEEKDD